MESRELLMIVKKHMQDVISACGLVVVEINKHDILLRSKTYAIEILVDREGVSFVYFDTANRDVKGYNIYLYLVNKRRDRLVFASAKPEFASRAEMIDVEVNALTSHLREAGADILEGEKGWIRDYSWGSVVPSKDVLLALTMSSSTIST